MSQPQVLPRPTRSSAPQSTTASSAAATPVVPPRPANRRDDRSESPRSNYPRSPLNDSPFPVDNSNDLQRVASLNASRSNLDLPARPPSVSLPSIGQEGSEYEASTPQFEKAVEDGEDILGTSPQHTRKVSTDLPLHAPKPSLSSSEAKQRVAAVVRTDSNQASATSAAPKLKPTASHNSLKAKQSFQRPGSSASHDRPSSAYGDEHGIPIFGQHVPLAHQYGDVQAPSPGPYGSQPQTPKTPGFDSSRPGTGRHHSRKHSGRNDFQAPPGSYGLHGHGVQDTSDPFEKDWLSKHPDALREELAAHSPAILDRHDYQLTPAELNKLVKQTRGAGFGASKHVSMPDEQIGYLVSEKYSSRGNTPGLEHNRPPSLHGPAVDSPLKRQSITAEDLEGASADQKVVHVDAPAYKESKHIGRGQVAESEHANFGPNEGNTEEAGGWQIESGYGVPILASDEVDPDGNHLQPAVPPIAEGRRGSAQLDDYGHSRPSSRPSSRPGSIHNMPALGRVISRNEHTPLEDVREYEPLFPEDEGPTKAKTPADRFKQRPDMKQRFPSQDIWEDAPESVMMSAEVETPEDEPPRAKPTFETPEQEQARKGEVSEAERQKLLPREVRLAQSNFKPHLKQEIRPGRTQQRFPSRDVWEDTPESSYMTTTVGEEEEEPNLADEAGAVVRTDANLSREGATAGAPAVPLPETSAAKPIVPPRPGRSVSPNKVAPQIPARPARLASPHNEQPSIPPRPTKAAQPSPAVESTTATGESSKSVDAAAISAKPKPQVPARPVGGKIAALQAGFMSDLNKKLGLGPQGPPGKKEETEEQPEEAKQPLEDARKGRARGPARRKPAASPSSAAAAAPAKVEPRKFITTQVYNLFDISPAGALTATHADTWEEKFKFSDGLKDTAKEISPQTTVPVAQEVAPAAGFNIAGEKVHVPTVTPEAVRATAQMESTPAMATEAAIAGEPDDTGHAGVSTSVRGTSTTEDETATPAASSKVEAEPAPETLTKQRTSSSSAGTQTGEMSITMDKNGAKQQTLKAYKDGSAHEEGYAFVKDEKTEADQAAGQS